MQLSFLNEFFKLSELWANFKCVTNWNIIADFQAFGCCCLSNQSVAWYACEAVLGKETWQAQWKEDRDECTLNM